MLAPSSVLGTSNRLVRCHDQYFLSKCSKDDNNHLTSWISEKLAIRYPYANTQPEVLLAVTQVLLLVLSSTAGVDEMMIA